MKRLPITFRLTLVFAAVMAAVLAATGLFLYVRLASELDSTVEAGLKSRADDVAALVRRTGTGPADSRHDRLTDADESFAQVIDLGGTVVGGTPEVGAKSLLSGSELARASKGPILVERQTLTGKPDGDPGRLVATPVDSAGRRLIVVVGASIDERNDALRSLMKQLLIGGPIALFLASLTAFGVARAALRPVELMRRQATAISGAEPGRRLELPETRDELSRLGETLNAMLARLEAALARERTFVADASHELRTPLAILKTEFELALRDGRSIEELQEAIRSAAQETDRLVQLAEDLLVVARSDHGRLPVRREPTIVAEVFEGIRRRFAARTAELDRDVSSATSQDATVLADRLRLEQALGNMVDNALRHGGGSVRLAVHETADRVELHVTDEGPGFPADFIEHAFERFSRASEARTRGGAGLGLAVVQGIAQAHGGTAHAANLQTGGADVWVSLPRHAVPAVAEEASAPLTAAGPSPPPQRRTLRRRRAPAALVLAALGAGVAVTFAVAGGNVGGSDEVRRVPLADFGLAAAVETKPVPHAGDAADDPAIWVDRAHPSRSAVIGTDKDGGIAVYDLRGRELQYLPAGKLNNVDLRDGFLLGGRRITLVAASNRSDETIALYRFDGRTRSLRAITAIPTGMDVYGLCMYRSPRTGAFHVFVTSEEGGAVEQWQVSASASAVTARRVRSFDVGGKAEGCVADDDLRRLYVAEEERGIWRYGAEPAAAGRRALIDTTADIGHLTADVEGLAIAEGPGRSGFLVASSQGDSTFAVYRRTGANRFVRTFEVPPGAVTDGVDDTDGIAVTTVPMGPRFPHGLFVAQDGENDTGNQNYKLVPWRDPTARSSDRASVVRRARNTDLANDTTMGVQNRQRPPSQ